MSPKTLFAAFTVKHTGRVDRILTPLGISQAENATPEIETRALWDTGATGSVITKSTASKLKLVPVGVKRISHAGGSNDSPTYIVNFHLPNKVRVEGVIVTECPDIAGNFGAIIGMDIISQGDFSISNLNGYTWMTYRIPSCQSVDFAAEANKIKFANVGRNDACPCGSGRKFKKCCGA